jgi:alkylated DNA nucleotide flippase Atl1
VFPADSGERGGGAPAPSLYQRIHTPVRLIPPGRVSTYGDIAALVGCGPRQVGYAMAALPSGSDVPWQRVVNARGRISLRSDGSEDPEQRTRLVSEGVCFDRRGRLDLDRHRWSGPDPEELILIGIDSPLF